MEGGPGDSCALLTPPLQNLAEGFLYPTIPPPSGLVQAGSLERPELFFAGLLPGEGEV